MTFLAALLVLNCICTVVQLVLLLEPRKTIPMSTAIEDSIAALEAEVAAHTSVDDSAAALLAGVTQRITDAVHAALAAQPLSPETNALAARVLAVVDKIKASDAKLSAAVVAGTPATVPTSTPVA